jgi:phosphatidylethanolamine N-methyltransferase
MLISKEHLRERMSRPDMPTNPTPIDNAQNTVKSLNQEEADKTDNKKRTYGRTPEGKGMPCCCKNTKHGYG